MANLSYIASWKPPWAKWDPVELYIKFFVMYWYCYIHMYYKKQQFWEDSGILAYVRLRLFFCFGFFFAVIAIHQNNKSASLQLFCLFTYWGRISLSSPNCPGTYSVDQDCLYRNARIKGLCYYDPPDPNIEFLIPNRTNFLCPIFAAS